MVGKHLKLTVFLLSKSTVLGDRSKLKKTREDRLVVSYKLVQIDLIIRLVSEMTFHIKSRIRIFPESCIIIFKWINMFSIR